MPFPKKLIKALDAPNTNVLLYFKGVMSHDQLAGIAELIKRECGPRGLGHIEQRIFALFIEMGQNVMQYSHERYWVSEERSYGKGEFLMFTQDDTLVMQTLNRICLDQAPALRDALKEVNRMTADEIKHLSSLRLRQISLTDARKTGLGFLEMQRKSENMLHFEFLPAGEGLLDFYLQLKLKTH